VGDLDLAQALVVSHQGVAQAASALWATAVCASASFWMRIYEWNLQ